MDSSLETEQNKYLKVTNEGGRQSSRFYPTLLNFLDLSFGFGFSSNVNAKLLQSCLTLCDPTDCSSPGSSVHGILQSGILEEVTISYSRGFS